MTLQEAINKIDKNNGNCKTFADIDTFIQELELHNLSFDYFGGSVSDRFNERMKKFWIHSWYCTDTWVGLAVYFFDGELACITQQPGRKWGEEFEWASQDMADRVEAFVRSLENDKRKNERKILDLNEELGSANSWNNLCDIMYSVLETPIR